MKRELLKGFAMLILVILLALGSAVVSAHGQSKSKIVADIPFDFVIGDTSMGAGKYALDSMGNAEDIWLVRNKNTARVRLVSELQSKQDRKEAKLIFHKYGQQYFLAEIWPVGNGNGRCVAKSAAERALEQQLEKLALHTNSQPRGFESVAIAVALR